MQVGGAQLYLNLVKAAGKLGSTLDSIGISLDEFLNSGAAKRKLTGGGKALLFDVKGMSEAVKRCDVIMHHEAAISIMESGVQVSF